MSRKYTIIGLGEALLDLFPDEAKLGGAPLNFTVHAHQLGNEGIVVSRIGQDTNGQHVINALHQRNMRTDHIQHDPDLRTGIVKVHMKPDGDHSFDIINNVAWDNMQWDPDLESLANEADALCFGSLAQRNGQTRNMIYRFVSEAHSALRLFDVNLRQQFYNRRILERSLELCSTVKCNEEELVVLNNFFSLGNQTDEIANALIKKFNLQWLALTRGAKGSVVFDGKARHEGETVEVDVSGGDAVGAGDSTSAALVHGAIRGWPWTKTLKLANTLGAYVATQKGACPPLTDDIKSLL